MRMAHCLLQVVLVSMILVPSSAVKPQLTAVHELYVRPNATVLCPHNPCHTLDEYVQNVSRYFVSSTTFHFLSGTHDLSLPIDVTNVAGLALVAVNDLVNITCFSNSYFSFSDVFNLTLRGLTLSLCNTLTLDTVIDLQLMSIAIQPPLNVRQLVFAKNVFGSSRIARISVLPIAQNGDHCDYSLRYMSLWYTDTSTSAQMDPPPLSTQLVFRDSFFDSPNSNTLLEFVLAQSTYAVALHLQNLTSTMQDLFNIVFEIESSASNFINITNLFLNETTRHGNGITIKERHRYPNSTSVYIGQCHFLQDLLIVLESTHLLIENCTLSNRSRMYVQSGPDLADGMIELRNVVFLGLALESCALDQDRLPCASIYLEQMQNVTFVGCKFIGNTIILSTIGTKTSVILLQGSRNVNFLDCEFSKNIKSPITAFNSTFILSGFNNFSYNSADEGGALAFYENSYVILPNGSHTLFQNNTASSTGGAIFVDYGFSEQCFFDLSFPIYPSVRSVNMTFLYNAAYNGGDAIYGASLDTCRYYNGQRYGWELTGSLFPKNVAATRPSVISSNPTRACLCEHRVPSCGTVFKNLSYSPGESFTISAVVVGDRFGTVDGSVYAHVLPLANTWSGEGLKLNNLQTSQNVDYAHCSELSYTIFSNTTGVVVALMLTAKSMIIRQYPSDKEIAAVENETELYKEKREIGPLLRSFPVCINVTLLPCPLGFMLSLDPPGHCTCDKQLTNHHINCDLATKTIHLSGSIWVNASFKSNESNGVILNTNCPNSYCKSGTLNLSLEDPDAQCAYNRSGILCGGCHSGRSLALGSNRCLHCSDDYLALLIPFALAGFALIFFVKFLNLTVAEGAINGLIFYANIVRANQELFLPGNVTNLLTVFIAWLNLDLGIEACFFDGMDAYWKTWLEFVFPLYIWMLVILIIVLARYSSLVAKVFGSNSLVPVLATIFLLSYAKLLRVIIAILQSSTLIYPYGITEKVWSYDGNIAYFSAKHIPLCLAALSFLVFSWLPYTTTLTFTQCLHKSSNYRVRRFLIRLKPFLDSYFGPFKDKHRYWVGLLLLVRGTLFVVFAATPTNLLDVDLLVILTVVLCLLVYLSFVGLVYRKVYHSLLENAFFLNLGILSAGTFFVRSSGGSQTALANISMGIAFAFFLAIVAFRFLALVKGKQVLKSAVERLQLQVHHSQAADRSEYQSIGSSSESRADGIGIHEFNSSCRDFREPVLKYLDSQT